MKLHYQLTLDELAEAGVQGMMQGEQWKPYIKRILWLGWLAYALAASFIWIWTERTGIAIAVFVLGIFVTYFILGNKRLVMRRIRRQLKKTYQLKGNERFLEPSTLEITEKNVRSKNKSSEGIFKWEAIQGCIEIPDLYILCLGSNFMPFPKRAFKTKAEEKATLKFIRKHLPKP